MARVHNPAPKAKVKTLKFLVVTGDLSDIKRALRKADIGATVVKEGGVDLKNLSKKLNDKGQPVTEAFEPENKIQWDKVLANAWPKKEEKKSSK